jgi:hypothetical protein
LFEEEKERSSLPISREFDINPGVTLVGKKILATTLCT